MRCACDESLSLTPKFASTEQYFGIHVDCLLVDGQIATHDAMYRYANSLFLHTIHPLKKLSAQRSQCNRECCNAGFPWNSSSSVERNCRTLYRIHPQKSCMVFKNKIKEQTFCKKHTFKCGDNYLISLCHLAARRCPRDVNEAQLHKDLQNKPRETAGRECMKTYHHASI